MARTKGSYSLSANIEINAAAPLDARERVATLADLTAEGSFPYHYVGMETYVVATGKKYRLTGSDPTVSANWAEIGEGGGGSGGHTIEDSTGTDMSSRSNLQFKGAAQVSDDSTNDRTVVDVPKMSSSDLSEIMSPLPTPSTAPDVEDLGDVEITSLANGQILKYDSQSEKWINANESGGGASDLADLGDVSLTTPTAGQVLTYDDQNDEWVNSDAPSGGHTIKNSSGTSMTDRSGLKFTGAASVTDDSSNDQTIVDVPIMPSSDMSEILNPPPQPNPAPDLSDLGDVNISSASNGQVLKYDSSTSKWINATDSGGAEDLDDLSDVDITSASNGQVLKYNSSTSKWENANEEVGVSDLDDLSDVDISSATDGQVLKWDDTTSKWVNADEDCVSSLEDLTDVDITSVTDGQSLKWDATNSKWVNDTVSGGHTIENASGTDLTARSNLQFKGAATATDDSTNDRTVVDVPIMPSSDMSEILTPLPGPNLVPDLEDLGDVNIQTLTDGQILKWDATNSEWVNGDESGGGSAGHTIENSTGTDMTARANLQFKGVAVVSDDSTNDRTVVDVPKMSSLDLSEIIDPLPTPSGGGGGHTIEDDTGTAMESRSNLQFTGAATTSDDSTNDRTVVDVPVMPSSDMTEILNPLPTPGGSVGGLNSYGTTVPTARGNDGDTYILLDGNNKKRGEYLYKTNAWVLIYGSGPFDGTIYDHGSEGISLTVSGGTKNDSSISLTVGGGTYTNYVITDEPIDVTDYDELSVSCRYRDQDYNTDFDISSYSGEKYISFVYITDNSHNECAVGLADTKTSAATFRVDSRNGGTAEEILYYLALS